MLYRIVVDLTELSNLRTTLIKIYQANKFGRMNRVALRTGGQSKVGIVPLDYTTPSYQKARIVAPEAGEKRLQGKMKWFITQS